MSEGLEKRSTEELWKELQTIKDFMRKVLWTAIGVAFVLGSTLGVLQYRVSNNSEGLTELTTKLEDQSAIIISRTQLEDILGVRDEKIENIEKSVESNGQKLDLLLSNH